MVALMFTLAWRYTTGSKMEMKLQKGNGRLPVISFLAITMLYDWRMFALLINETTLLHLSLLDLHVRVSLCF
jgi:hypothetical protein